MKKGLIVLFALAALTCVFCAQGAYAGVPQMINYQGTLTDKNGTPVANGNYSMEFKIYDVASGGAALWSEKWDTTSPITVVGGIFNAMLGFLSPIPAAFFADHPVAYLGIKVGTDSEMLPRQQITSVGYAFNAGNGVPKGGIIMWSGAVNQIPAGWALCDGTNGTPDLRDRFVVGAGNSYAVASTGGSATRNLSHNHPYSGTTANGDTYNAGPRLRKDSDENYLGHTHNYSGTTNSGGSANQDSLPPYYSLAYIMKL